MWRGVGIFLLIAVFGLTIFFAYSATTIVIPTEFTKLLPDHTNWGKVQIALKAIDVDLATYSGVNSDGSSSPGSIIVSQTAPTPIPTDATTAPTTAMPTAFTASPTTAMPTADTPSPTTALPSPPPVPNPTPSPTLATLSPITADPTSQSPSVNPTAVPTANPTGTTTLTPSINPSAVPSVQPLPMPTNAPFINATLYPTPLPTAPTFTPSFFPSVNPSTSMPTLSPTTGPPTVVPTAMPSLLPTTGYPSVMPTVVPTGHPSIMPTFNPSVQPTVYPTAGPIFEPDYRHSYFSCANSETTLNEVTLDALLVCTVYFVVNVSTTGVNASKFALVLEGAASNYFSGCDASDGVSPYYSSTVYGSTLYNDSNYNAHNVIWCYPSVAKWSTYINHSFTFILNATSVPTSDAWWLITYWLYDTPSGTWERISNSNNALISNSEFNFSIVTAYSTTSFELALELSVSVTLLFGTSHVTGYETDCSGSLSSGVLYFDSDFNFYLDSVQNRLIDLCNELDALQASDPIMYRTTEQKICWPRVLKSYCEANIANFTQICSWPMGSNVEFVNTVVNYWLTEEPIAGCSDEGCGSFYNGSDFTSNIGFDKKLAAMRESWDAKAARINYVSQTVRTQIPSSLGGFALQVYYKRWEKFMKNFNSGSPNALQGVQTSGKYIFMEVELAFITGFIKSVWYTLVLCGLVMIFFTQNLALVLIVTIYILTVVIWIVGVFGAAQWPFGIIEIISVPTVVGLTIDYALHITHAYIHSPFYDRRNRSKSAVNDLGLSVMASALTTISSMIVLYYSTIVIFSDLGWVVATTTGFGIFLALFVCPPLLMYVGPQRDTCHVRWFMRVLCKFDPEPCYVLGCVICDRPSNHWISELDDDIADMDGFLADMDDSVDLKARHSSIMNDLEGAGNDNAVMEYQKSLSPNSNVEHLQMAEVQGVKQILQSSVVVYPKRSVEMVDHEQNANAQLSMNMNLSLTEDNAMQNSKNLDMNVMVSDFSGDTDYAVIDQRDVNNDQQLNEMDMDMDVPVEQIVNGEENKDIMVAQTVEKNEIQEVGDLLSENNERQSNVEVDNIYLDNNNNGVVLEESVSLDISYDIRNNEEIVADVEQYLDGNNILNEFKDEPKAAVELLNIGNVEAADVNINGEGENDQIEIGEGEIIALEESISFNPEVA